MSKRGLNAQEVLQNIDKCIKELNEVTPSTRDYHRHKSIHYQWRTGKANYGFCTDEVYEELSIFDWWRETLSMSQLKQMRAFVQTAIKLGFTGYVCFKVGATGCANGMWAYTAESTDGYSPRSGDILYHSFVCTDNYWSACFDGQWMGDRDHFRFTLAEVKTAQALAKEQRVG